MAIRGCGRALILYSRRYGELVHWQACPRGCQCGRRRSGEPDRGQGANLTSDQLQNYAFAIPAAFDNRADHARKNEVFQSIRADAPTWQTTGVNPLVEVQRRAVHGNPDLRTSTACQDGAAFPTMRQCNKCAARKTPGVLKVVGQSRAHGLDSHLRLQFGSET